MNSTDELATILMRAAQNPSEPMYTPSVQPVNQTPTRPQQTLQQFLDKYKQLLSQEDYNKLKFFAEQLQDKKIDKKRFEQLFHDIISKYKTKPQNTPATGVQLSPQMKEKLIQYCSTLGRDKKSEYLQKNPDLVLILKQTIGFQKNQIAIKRVHLEKQYKDNEQKLQAEIQQVKKKLAELEKQAKESHDKFKNEADPMDKLLGIWYSFPHNHASRFYYPPLSSPIESVRALWYASFKGNNFKTDLKQSSSNMIVLLRNEKEEIMKLDGFTIKYNNHTITFPMGSIIAHIPNKYSVRSLYNTLNISTPSARSFMVHCLTVVYQDTPTLKSIVQNRPVLQKHTNSSQDNEVLLEKHTLSLIDPISQKRLSIPIKGKDCNHISCTDLEHYLEYSKEMNEFKCQVCDRPLPFDSILIDGEMVDLLESVKSDTITIGVDGEIICDEEKEVVDVDSVIQNPKKRKFEVIDISLSQ